MKSVLVASNHPKAQEAAKNLQSRYDLTIVTKREEVKEADVILVLGGDGFMLHTLHHFRHLNIPFYGINRGTVGFLMNTFAGNDLLERIKNATPTTIHPLVMETIDENGNRDDAVAINEVSLLRQSGQAAKISILLDGKEQMEELVCDGILLATPAGSSAYNYSANGPIMPIESNMLALTPISPFRPRRWRGALLPQHVTVTFRIKKHATRPVSAVADYFEVKNIMEVSIKQTKDIPITLLFDKGHSLEERILHEQFAF